MGKQAIAKISGGTGSYAAARQYVKNNGSSNLELLFTDTLVEDQDAYRFLIAGAAKLYNIDIPKGFLPEISDFPAWQNRPAYKAFCLSLAIQTMELIPGLHWIADGRDPWDVYEHERFLGNSLADPCSKILKRQLADRWLKQNCEPSETEVIVGIDFEEIERFEGCDKRKTRGLRRRMADEGWAFIAPLCQPPISSYGERLK
ncbi:hypothetical protein ACQKHB_23200, partial [Escherichia coli]|uniref:hypothetical protein n=1 Tax=Escherichia coli TaxID=562 RepID=UPI003D0405C2